MIKISKDSFRGKIFEKQRYQFHMLPKLYWIKKQWVCYENSNLSHPSYWDQISQGLTAWTISYSNITFILQKQLVYASVFKVSEDYLLFKSY